MSKTYYGFGTGDVTFEIKYLPVAIVAEMNNVTAKIYNPKGVLITTIGLSATQYASGLLYVGNYIPMAGRGSYRIVIDCPDFHDELTTYFFVLEPVKQTIVTPATIKEVYVSPATATQELNLARECDILIDSVGYDFLLRRLNSDKSCFCVNGNEYNTKCSYCVKGHPYTDSIVRAFPIRNRQTSIEYDVRAMIGDIDFHEIGFILKADANPADKDYIFEVVVDNDGNAVTPIKITKGYESELDPMPFRDDQGKLAYWFFAAVKVEFGV